MAAKKAPAGAAVAVAACTSSVDLRRPRCENHGKTNLRDSLCSLFSFAAFRRKGIKAAAAAPCPLPFTEYLRAEPNFRGRPTVSSAHLSPPVAKPDRNGKESAQDPEAEVTLIFAVHCDQR